MDNKELIKKHLERWEGLQVASIENYAKTGKISGFLYLAIEKMLDEKAKEANETIEMLRHSLAQATANRIFEKENIEKEAYNQGVRDAAESVELHTPTTAPPKIGKWHSLPINKDSILKLLK